MGLLNRQQRQTLITLLEKLPNLSDTSTRQLLVATLPDGLCNAIVSANVVINHIHHIVDTTEDEVWAPLPDGSYPVTIVIENAVGLVRGSRLAEELRILLTDLQARPVAITSPTYQPPKISNFDLTWQIERCFDELEPRRGLLGFAIPCDLPDFQDHFCERLLDRLRQSYLDTEIRRPAPLKLKFTSIDGAIQEIKRYKHILQYKNLLCPIQVQIYDEEGCADLLLRFWRSLTNEFAGNLQHRLILLMLSGSMIPCPPNIIQLESPTFKESDLRQWFAQIVRGLQWAGRDADANQVIELWKGCVFSACHRNDQLAMSYLYDYLKDTLEILQQRPSREQFFQELTVRSQNYV